MKKMLLFYFLLLSIFTSLYSQNAWTQTSFPIKGNGQDCVYSMTEIDKNIFVGSTQGLFISKDEGISWKHINPEIFSVNHILQHNNIYYILTTNGQLYTTPDFESFTDFRLPMVQHAFDLYAKNDEIFVATSGGIYVMDLSLQEWSAEPIEGGNESFTEILSFTSFKDILYAVGCGHIYKRIDKKWYIVPSQLDDCGLQLMHTEDRLMLNTSGQGIMVANPEDSSDVSYIIVDPNEPYCYHLSSLYLDGTAPYAMSTNYLYDINNKVQEYICDSRLSAMLTSNGKVYIGTSDKGVWIKEYNNTNARNSDLPSIIAYPNPVLNENVTIELSGDVFPNNVYVYDTNGRKVLSMLSNKSATFNIRLENAGLYRAVIKSANHTLYQTIVNIK